MCCFLLTPSDLQKWANSLTIINNRSPVTKKTENETSPTELLDKLNLRVNNLPQESPSTCHSSLCSGLSGKAEVGRPNLLQGADP